jgi:ATP-dependent DNA helicase RecG
VFDICAWKPHSARELAMLLGRRDHKHLVKELLSPMVAQGLLAFTIPSMEKHPEQRYAARRATDPQG